MTTTLERSEGVTVTVQIKRLSSLADMPAYQSALAAGMDLHAAVDGPVTIEPGDIAMIPCGFAVALPAGYEAQVRPRSGLAARHGISIPNAPGTIDGDYRGEVSVPLINHGKQPFTVDRNMRIAQMVIAPVAHAHLLPVRRLDETPRGEGGFGSTGL